jgi:hypothetical protein
MAVWAQRHHVARMIFAAFRQILDMVDIQDRLTPPSSLGWHAGTAQALASPAGADQHGPPSCCAARIVGSHHPVGASRLAPLVDASDQGSVGGSRLSLRSSNVITLGGGGRVFQCLNNIAWPLLGCWPWDRLQAPLQLRPWLAVLADACYPRATKDGDPGKERESAAGWPIPEPDGRPGDPGTLQPCVPAGIHPLRPVQAFAPVPKRLSLNPPISPMEPLVWPGKRPISAAEAVHLLGAPPSGVPRGS